jgi:hypothetical protein
MAHSTFGKHLGQVLRSYYDGIAKEPLPERWVHLIECLNDKAEAVSPTKPPPQISNWDTTSASVVGQFENKAP